MGGKRICSPLLILSLFLLLLPQSGYSETVSVERVMTYEEYIDSADYYSGRKNWEKAEAMTVNALRLKPAHRSNWLLWSNLGEIREKLGDIDGALTAYNIGLSLQPQSKKMLSNRAALLIEDGKQEAALSDLATLIEADSVAEWPRMIRGMIFLESGEVEIAETDF